MAAWNGIKKKKIISKTLKLKGLYLMFRKKKIKYAPFGAKNKHTGVILLNMYCSP